MNKVGNFFGKVINFVNEVRAELKKISWPGRDELVGSTIIVCILVVVFAIILGTMDGVFNYAIKFLIS